MSKDALTCHTRRNFITGALAGAATVAFPTLPLKVPLSFNRKASEAPLRVAVCSWTPSWIKSEVEQRFARQAEEILGRKLLFTRVPSSHLFDSPNFLAFDVFLTSDSFHYWPTPANVFFGALPFGMNRDQKAQWLYSDAGLRLHRTYLASFDLVPQPIALGSDDVGLFSKSRIENLSSLEGKSVAARDFRSNWYKSAGMRTHPVPLPEQGFALTDGRIDLSEPFVPSAYISVKDAVETSDEWTYFLFPGFRTAPVANLYWKKSSWNQIERAHGTILDRIAQDTFTQASSLWLNRESEALAAIGRKHFVEALPQSVVNHFRNESGKYHQALMAQSELLSLIGTEYFKNKNSEATIRTS